MGKLSGGQKARLSLAAVLYHKPHLLILDEPTNHLDADALHALAPALAAFAGGVVAVSHSSSFLASWCSELWILRAGTGAVERHPVADRVEFEAAFGRYCDGFLSEFGRGAVGGAGKGRATAIAR